MGKYDLASINIGTMLCHECSPSEHCMLFYLYDKVLDAAFQAALTQASGCLCTVGAYDPENFLLLKGAASAWSWTRAMGWTSQFRRNHQD